jgi:hypothetical protein
MKIKRYDMGLVSYGLGDYMDMIEKPEGDYVKYEDVKPLLKELEKLRKEKNLL